MLVIDICLSDIPKSSISKSDKNGKSYAKFVIDERKQPDNYGNTHSVAVNQTKEQREAKEAKVYVGSGKEYVFNANNTSKKTPTTGPDVDDSDLPF